MQDGDLLFFSGKSIWSRIIKARSNSKFSHVGMMFWFNGEQWVIEALEGKGVRLVPRSIWKHWKGKTTAMTLTLTGSQREKMIRYALHHVGCEYASRRQFVRSFSLVWSKLANWLKLRADTDRSRFFCSELCLAAIRNAGLLIHKQPARTSPEIGRAHV